VSALAHRPGLTVEAARRELASRLKSASIESAELDARLLVGAVMEFDLTGIITAADRRLTPEQADHLEQLARRRLAGEPVARILGHKEFWSLPLQLSPATLVPRPDTETIVEFALEILRADDRIEHPLRIADLGTGSGAILFALLFELPKAQGYGTDLSLEALKTARANAARLGLADRASFVRCDYAAGLAGPFDLIVSNPPYIPSGDIAGLSVEVRDHDPIAALDGGTDGLDAYRALIPETAAVLVPGGLLIVEVGQGQSRDVEALMTASGLAPEGSPRPDLAGIERGVAGRKRPR
jgi:release factor glutamine methyltransferase